LAARVVARELGLLLDEARKPAGAEQAEGLGFLGEGDNPGTPAGCWVRTAAGRDTSGEAEAGLGQHLIRYDVLSLHTLGVDEAREGVWDVRHSIAEPDAGGFDGAGGTLAQKERFVLGAEQRCTGFGIRRI
jgi:hypothetical protein